MNKIDFGKMYVIVFNRRFRLKLDKRSSLVRGLQMFSNLRSTFTTVKF